MKSRTIAALLTMVLLPLAQHLAFGFENCKDKGEYTIKYRYPLNATANGTAGELQLLLDRALTEEDLDMQRASPKGACAKLRVVTGADKVLSSKNLGWPAARLTPALQLKGSPAWYLLEVNQSAEFGSYSGAVASFVRARNAQFDWLQAVDKQTGKSEKIQLLRSGKTDWRLAKSSQTKAVNLVELACRPDFENKFVHKKDELEFMLIYRRYYPQGDGRWIRAERTQAGFWESDEDFPDEREFPF